MKTSIIIINWNTRDLLACCLTSIMDNHLHENIEIFVVDNDSTDGSAGMVAQCYPQVRLIENRENVGFARANNQAIRQSSGRYVLLLNPDTEVRSGALDALVDFMDEHTEVGVAGARLFNPDGSLQYSCSPQIVLWREFIRLFHLGLVRQDGYYSMGDWDIRTPRKVDTVLGACMILRREVLDQVGLLDEDYFMYTEEVDLCYRIRKAGWKIYWVPQAQIVHFGGQSTKQVATEMFLKLYESKILFFRKHYHSVIVQAYKMLLGLAAWPRIVAPSLYKVSHIHTNEKSIILADNYRRLLTALPGM
jgi:GT2 family glycosyltransferase